MDQSFITSSPKSNLADLFLDTVGLSGPQFSLDRRRQEIEQSFDSILSNSLAKEIPREVERYVAPTDGSGSSTMPESSSATSGPRKNPVAELTERVEEVGLPLDSMSLNEEDLPKIKKFLQKAGLSEEEANKILSELSEGPLTMDRVLALLSTAVLPKTDVLKLTEDSLPLLGQFLQDLGLNADAVKEMLETLEPGQHFGAEKLQEMLLKLSDKNLKGPTLAGVDKDNLNRLMESLGVPDKDMKNLWTKMEQTGNRMSLEGFLGFLKSVERPAPITPEQMANIEELVNGLKSESTLRSKPYFNRIVSLLQSMGDKDLNPKNISDNPAIQALRGGAASARAVTEGSGTFGQGNQSNGGGQGSQTGQGFADAAARVQEAAKGSARTESPALSSRLSEAIAKQVADKIAYQVHNNRHQLNVRLEPQDLGRININMVMKNGSVQASIMAENPAVKAALEEQMSQLKAVLAEQGLELDKFEVSLGWDREQADFAGRQEWNSGSSRGRSDRTISMEEDITTTTAASTTDRGRVDRMI